MAKAFPIYIKGPNELQEYISHLCDMKNQIKTAFEAGLSGPIVSLEYDNSFICRPWHHHQAEMCCVAHRDFIHKTITAEMTSGTEQAEAAINVAVKQLERFRKMLVDNKRHRKTTHTQNRAACLHFMNEVAFNHEMMSSENELENDPRDHHPCVLVLKQMDAASKQHHRTVAKKILKEINGVVLVIRKKLILAYQLSTENAIGAIIHHAEKGRELIQKCQQLAMVEYCATVWWFNTQKDAMDDADYYVDASSIPGGQIRIVVKEISSNRVVFDDCMNQEFADTIITDEAVESFEWTTKTILHSYAAATDTEEYTTTIEE